MQSELSSLAIQCKRKNEFNDEEELEALTTAIKEVYFQDYKTAYNDTSDIEIDQSHLAISFRYSCSIRFAIPSRSRRALHSHLVAVRCVYYYHKKRMSQSVNRIFIMR